jgi:hypothetical protein
MEENGLVSKYTVAQFKPHVDKCNESKVENELNRKFDQQKELTVVVSDLTYVRVESRCITYVSFDIKRSLSMKGCPYDNAVAEATIKIIKTEFIKGKYIHRTIGHLSPIEYKREHLKKVV